MLEDNQVIQPPTPELLALYKIGVIGKIEIDYRHMHTERGGTYIRMHGNLGSIDGKWKKYEKYLDMKVEWNSIAKIKAKFSKELEDWWIYSETNRKELDEYERLKKKFEAIS